MEVVDREIKQHLGNFEFELSPSPDPTNSLMLVKYLHSITVVMDSKLETKILSRSCSQVPGLS